jgi:hypothetical protein
MEPSLRFLEISISALQAGKEREESESDGWALEAKRHGWVSEREARVIWEQIARNHGWLPPEGPKMVIETAVIENYFPGQSASDDLIAFTDGAAMSSAAVESDAIDRRGEEFIAELFRTKAFNYVVVFERTPRRLLEAPHEIVRINVR